MTKLSLESLVARIDERTLLTSKTMEKIEKHMETLNGQTESNTKGRIANESSIKWIVRIGGTAILALGSLFGINL